jgi:6-pyruvoyl-tetrahydropterin synthase
VTSKRALEGSRPRLQVHQRRCSFTDINPSTENIAEWFWHDDERHRKNTRVDSVTIWERSVNAATLYAVGVDR